MRSLVKLISIGFFGAVLALVGVPAKPVLAQSAPLQIPFIDEWVASPHAWHSREAFTHWNDEGEIPTACAKCHSTAGFHDYLGLGGSEAGKVDKPALPGKGITCVACHNTAIQEIREVTFPSGAVIEHPYPDARCLICHQGRQSTPQVNEALADAGAGDDQVSDKLRFLNVHYRAAAATRFGTEAQGGYEYTGKKYVGLYLHDEDSTLCIDCHDNHTLRVSVERCVDCHEGVKERKDYVAVRTTKKDYDGDGDVTEGIAGEVEALHERFYSTIQDYAAKIAGKAIVYESHQYPYYFTDKNGNGAVDEGEANYPNRYKSWTPRLLKAAYNYQFVAKDPGAYVHNPFYTIQLLHDSLDDLSTKVSDAATGLTRP